MKVDGWTVILKREQTKGAQVIKWTAPHGLHCIATLSSDPPQQGSGPSKASPYKDPNRPEFAGQNNGGLGTNTSTKIA